MLSPSPQGCLPRYKLILIYTFQYNSTFGYITLGSVGPTLGYRQSQLSQLSYNVTPHWENRQSHQQLQCVLARRVHGNNSRYHIFYTHTRRVGLMVSKNFLHCFQSIFLTALKNTALKNQLFTISASKEKFPWYTALRGSWSSIS